MLTVRKFLEHSDPQQRFSVYPGNNGLEDSGKAKDLLKECWYLDNEVKEFYLSATSEKTIGIVCRQSIGVDCYKRVTLPTLSSFILNTINKMRSLKNGYREIHSVMDIEGEDYDIVISLTRRKT